MQENTPDLQITKNKSQLPPSLKNLFKGVPKGFLSSLATVQAHTTKLYA